MTIASTQRMRGRADSTVLEAGTRVSPGIADARAGLIVFLVALPLCLGIANACGAPPLAGLIAGMVGGTLVGFVSGANLSVAGPAAGLTTIALAGIRDLGFSSFLAAVVIAGGMQIALGTVGLGRLIQLVPNSVIRGMLASIGLILVLKQIPHAVGWDFDYEGDMDFIQEDGRTTFSELLQALGGLHFGAIAVSICSALAFAAWRDWGSLRLTRYVPRELVCVAGGLFSAWLLRGSMLELSSDHLVSVPSADRIHDLPALWTQPAWPAFQKLSVWKLAGVLALVASIESLLSTEATDRLDPFRRRTPPNRELIAQGLGNLTSGCLGGLPLTAVVVRSFTNVQAGGRTRWSAVTHGLLLLIFTLSFTSVLNQIPLAALAVILLVVGHKLTAPAVYKSMWQRGRDQFIPFIVTVGATLLTNLLQGVIFGIVAAVFLVVYRNSEHAVVVVDDGDRRLIRLSSYVSFLHKAQLQRALDVSPEQRELILDGTRVRYLDPEILELLKEVEQHAPEGTVELSIKRNLAAPHAFFRSEVPA